MTDVTQKSVDIVLTTRTLSNRGAFQSSSVQTLDSKDSVLMESALSKSADRSRLLNLHQLNSSDWGQPLEPGGVTHSGITEASTMLQFDLSTGADQTTSVGTVRTSWNGTTVDSMVENWSISTWLPETATNITGANELLTLPLFAPFNDSCTYYYADNSSFMNETNCTDTNLFDGDAMLKNYWALLLLVFPLFTVFGNVLVILSVKRERTLHNVTNYFIVSLAVADLLVAAAVMPFAVYFLVNRMEWGLPPIFCDFYIAMDVSCSTSSICNLVAISIDRFIAVTQPIKYAKHKSNTRVWLTIVFVWVFSGLVGSPIVLGLNSSPADEPSDTTICTFHNKYFVLFSSLCSFYIPCAILVCLYYRIFKVIRERAKKAAGGRKCASSSKGSTVIENLAQTKRLAETTLGGSSSLPTGNKLAIVDDDKLTNTGSGSQDEDVEKDGDLDVEGEIEDASPDSDDCHIISNNQVATTFVLASVRDDERSPVGRSAVEANGNHDSGYAASNLEESPFPVQEASQLSPKHSLLHPDNCKRNGLSQSSRGESSGAALEEAGPSSSAKAGAPSRFTICKVHKASRKKREKSSAKRERKATKTLAIVLGLFLACWLPFFTCNIMDALCALLAKVDCSPGITPFLLTTWLGYVNSCLNPVIYTIFNPEFRKAFKKIMGLGA